MKKGYKSDGASGAIDIDGPIVVKDLINGGYLKKSLSYFVHDKLCEDMCWADGTPCSNWQASQVLKDILYDEGHWVRDRWWFLSTWIFRMAKTRKW
jgi:hypothetical protein